MDPHLDVDEERQEKGQSQETSVDPGAHLPEKLQRARVSKGGHAVRGRTGPTLTS